MNIFDEFKSKMLKVGAKFSKRESGKNPFFILDKYIEIQVTSTHEQHEASLIAVTIALRK